MEKGNEKPSYYSVIPAEVRYCAALGKPTARDLYGEIAALCNKHGYCFASNEYLASLYDIEGRTIRRYLAALEAEGFIYVKAGKQRKIYLAHASKFDPKGLREPASEEETPDFVEASSHGRINGIPEKQKKPAKKKGAGDYSEDFERFWLAYPRKTGKGAAWQAWLKVDPNAELVEKIITVTGLYAQTPQWKKDGGQFIPHPTTFLNQRRFDDTPEVKVSVGGNKYGGL